MVLQHAYAITNKASGLADTAFTWSGGGTTNRSYVVDGRMDRKFTAGAATSSATLLIDFGAATSLSAIALLNTNIATATSPTVKVEALTSVGPDTGLITPKAVTTPNASAPRHKDHVLQFTAVSKRYWRLTFTWTGSFNLTIGELFCAETTVLTRAMTYGNTKREDYITTRFTTYTGETRGHFIAGPIRIRDFIFEDLSAAERDEVLAMFRATYGGTLPILWIEAYEATATAADNDHQEVIYGRLDQASLSTNEFDFGRYNPDGLSLRSLGREIGA